MAGPRDRGANPINVINDTPMGTRQYIVVVMMVLLNALDGFDVLSSAFAAPGIMEDWGISRTELGVVLSAELVGMGFGSVILGGVAGIGHESLWDWRIAALLTMFFLNAVIVGYYAAFALSFPAYARAGGTGFVLGVGRLGAAGSPIVAGALFDYFGQDELFVVSAIMSVGSVIAMLLLWIMPVRDADEEAMKAELANDTADKEPAR